jgi:AsmA protein
MRKLLVVSLLVLVAFVAGVWWLLSDANRYKPQVVDLIQSRTGLAVAIQGDLSWRLWPPVQLVAQSVSADWAADAKEPMLTARTLRLDADLWPLLSRNPKLVIQGVAVDGLRAKLEQRGEHANWMPPGHAGPAVAPLPVPPPSDSASPDSPHAWEVASVTLNDAVIDYAVDGKATQIVIDALQMKGIAPTRRFPLHAKLTVKSAEREIPLNVAADITFDQAVTLWQLDAIDVGGVYGNPGPTFRLRGDARMNTAAGTLTMDNGHVDIAKVAATFDVAAADLLTSARYSGHLDLPQQPLDSVAGLVGTQIDKLVGLKTTFEATDKRLDLTDTEFRYGPSLAKGTLGTPIGGKLNLTFDLTADRFVVPSKKTAIASIGAGSFAALAFAAPSVALDPSLEEPVLPLELIRAIDWNGKFTVAQLVYEGATFTNAKLLTSNYSGGVDAAVDLPEFFGGAATTQLKIDAATNTPQWSVVPKLNHVDSQALLKWLDAKYDWVAFFLAGSDLTLRGNTRHDLIASLTGHTTFDGGQGVISITEIKNAALAVANIAGGTDKVKAWPDRLKYQRFTGNWDAKGTEHVIDVALDNLTLKAKGKFDALADDMDLRATVTVDDDPKYNSFKVSSSMTGVGLPIRCKGSIAAPKCGADEEGTRQLIADALSGKNPEAKEKLDKAIDEKVPEQYRDAARSLLEMLNKGNQQKQKTP